MSEELRKAELIKAYLEAQAERVNKFIRTYGCHLANHTDITEEILGTMNNRDEDWPWVKKWTTTDAPAWVNDSQTLVFELPLSNLTGRNCLDFTRDVWNFQPTIFEHQTWGGRTFVRMYWDDQSSYYRTMQAVKSVHYNQGLETGGLSDFGPSA
jgi:hypothetical protein